MSELLKITKKIVGYKVATPEQVEEAFVDLLDTKVSDETIKPLGNSLYEKIEALKAKAELKRPRKLSSETYRIKPPHYEHAIYVHISDILYEGKKHPFEIFFNCKNPENIMWVSTITLLLSATFREAITGNNNITKVINNLKEVCDASGGYFATAGDKKKHVGSIVAEIGYILEDHIKECKTWNYSQSSHERPATEGEQEAAFNFNLAEIRQAMESPRITIPKEAIATDKAFEEWIDKPVTNPCPDCGSQLTKQAGCDICLSCGYSKCS